ncbi:DUF5119 domain-containing protein [Dysgonomonas macrotermitis]|uniref:Fimbrillin-A associated anchor protein Mfa1 and Mfa2 n=1 Tax=Dysgonomonas macrotermitis TaxID=1346286 RepID=A0A1M5J8A1_9BACT|nr:DUF5119 domain-containing protein [Dysgonomonas macrotermitis]SHG36817.1 protein of unknown function [Dysgonomonas macrotermitis]
MNRYAYLKALLYAILSICCSNSCSLVDFSEDCTYYGHVEIKPDWSELPQQKGKPGLTDIHFLSCNANNRDFRISNDTIVKDMIASTYKVLAFNSYGLQNISFTDMGCPQTANAVLDTYERDSKVYTYQAPDLYAANIDLTVVPFDTVICSPLLRPATRQVNIHFIVIDNGITKVEAINGELSGIAYIYGLENLDQIKSSARIAFNSVRYSENDNIYSSGLQVFGINPDKQGQGRIDNLLDISLLTTNGNSYSETIDLTSVFSGFTTRIINITIEIRLGLSGIEVSVSGWNVSDGGHIEL